MGALSLGSSAVASTMYPDGVFSADDLTLADLLGDGWSVVHDVTYSAGLNHSLLSSQVGSAYVFVGAVDAAGNVVVGATGLASEVLSQTNSSGTAVSYASSNLYWYNVYGASMGFSGSQNISLSSADITGIWTPDDGLNHTRLSWHDNSGGWRAGGTGSLNGSTSFRKVVLTAATATVVGVPETASTLVLLGLAFTGLVAARRGLRA